MQMSSKLLKSVKEKDLKLEALDMVSRYLLACRELPDRQQHEEAQDSSKPDPKLPMCFEPPARRQVVETSRSISCTTRSPNIDLRRQK